MLQSVSVGGFSQKVMASTGAQRSTASSLFSPDLSHVSDQRVLASVPSPASCLVTVLDIGSAQVVQTLSGHGAPVSAVRWGMTCLSPFGPHPDLKLLTADSKGHVFTWNVVEGVVSRRTKVPSSHVVSMRPRKDGALLFTADGECLWWGNEVESLKSLGSIGQRIVTVCESSLSEDRVYAILGQTNVLVGGIDPASRQELQLTPIQSESHIRGVCFSGMHREAIVIVDEDGVRTHDWVLDVRLQDCYWHQSDNETEQLFTCDHRQLLSGEPEFFTYGDQRLSSWTRDSEGALEASTIDCRGHRLQSRSVWCVSHFVFSGEIDGFCVAFTDGSLVVWHFHVDERAWEMVGCCQHLVPSSTAPVPRTESEERRMELNFASERHVEVVDMLYSRSQRRFELLHAGNISVDWVLAPRPGHLLLAISRHVGDKFTSQVCLFDTDVGEPLRVYRPGLTVEAKSIAQITLDATSQFFLISYDSNAFEVWSLEGESAIHVHQGYSINTVCWGPPGIQHELGLDPRAVLLCIFGDGESMQLASVAGDRLRNLRDSGVRTSSGSSVRIAVSTSSKLICFDGAGCGVVGTIGPRETRWQLLQGTPRYVASHASVPTSGAPLVAVVFEDGSMGIWNADNRKRLGYRPAGDGFSGSKVVWIGDDFVAALTTDGCVHVSATGSCDNTNSSFYSKCLASPCTSPAFMLPELISFLHTTLSWPEVKGSTEGSDVSERQPSYIVRNEVFPPPYCSPMGQRVTELVETLAAELDLALGWLPEEARCCREGDHATTSLAAAARFFGDTGRERFWLSVQSSSTTRFVSSRDALSDVMMSSDVVRESENRMNRLRTLALNRDQTKPVDDTRGRVFTARKFVLAGEKQSAADLLVDSHIECPTYDVNATLACAIAASIGSPGEAFIVAAKRAAAMLLARDDVDGAVEKFCLTDDYYEAGLALQSKGRWLDATRLAQMSPMSAEQKNELIVRWSSHIARHGNPLGGARLLVHFGLSKQAVLLLAGHPEFIDVAGRYLCLLAAEHVDAEATGQPFFKPEEQDGADRCFEDYRNYLLSIHHHRAAASVEAVAARVGTTIA